MEGQKKTEKQKEKRAACFKKKKKEKKRKPPTLSKCDIKIQKDSCRMCGWKIKTKAPLLFTEMERKKKKTKKGGIL